MQVVDFTPSLSPSVDEQRDALGKGMGRALQWAMAGRLDDGPLLGACLRDQRYDMMCEDARGNWLWRIVQILQAESRLRVPILHALYELPDDRSARQLCELARHYADIGDETFLERLYEIVEQKPVADMHWLGEQEIVQVDGVKGFLFAARVRGRRLTHFAWEWDDERLIDHAIEMLGESAVTTLLLDTAADTDIQHFHRAWCRQTARRAERDPHRTHKDRRQAICVKDLIAKAESENSEGASFRGWGMHATENDLRTVFRHLRSTSSPKSLERLLSVFSNRALPDFDPRLIELCRHDDDGVRRWAFNALKMNTDCSIREFAITELQKDSVDPRVLGLLIRNYAKGDETLILESVGLPDDLVERHSLLMDIIKILENNPESDCSQLAVNTYGATPCENCRFDAARLLHRQLVAPPWMIEECRYDSNEQCRQLAET